MPKTEPGAAAGGVEEWLATATWPQDLSEPVTADKIKASIMRGMMACWDAAYAAGQRDRGWVRVEERLPEHWRLSSIDASILASGREPSSDYSKASVTLVRCPEEASRWHAMAKDVDPDGNPEEWAALPDLYIREGGETIELAFEAALARAHEAVPLPDPPQEPER